MRALIVSKALVTGVYRRKLQELAALGVDVVAVAPPSWRESGGVQSLEPSEDAGYRLIVSPIRFNGHFHLHYYPDLVRVLRAVRPHIVHVDEEPYNLATYLAVRAARRQRIPAIFFTWQNLLRRYPVPFRTMEKRVYMEVAAAIAGSQEAAEVLRAKGYTGPAFEVPQFGVDPDLFFPADGPSRPFTVGFPNRLIAAKSPVLALRAFARLPGDSRMEIVGDGPLRADVEAEIALLGLRDRVCLRSRVSSSEMPDFYRRMDVVLLPSVSTSRWKEQFGRVLIEAMATGVAVVASASGEIPHVLGEAGLLVPEGDEGATAGAVRRLHGDATLRRHLGQLGRERVLEHFTHARIAQRTLQVYERVLDASDESS